MAARKKKGGQLQLLKQTESRDIIEGQRSDTERWGRTEDKIGKKSGG